MRTVIIAFGLMTLALSSGACLRHTQTDGEAEVAEPKGAPGWPDGYQSWRKLNAEPIVREDEGVARELFGKLEAGLGQGTVLVKEQYALVGGVRGDLKQVAVMVRTGAPDGPNGGWDFKVYDPDTKAPAGDIAACVGCHSLRAEQGYLFTPAEQLQ